MMLKLGIIIALVAVCGAANTNEEWEPNNQIVKIYSIMYSNLALTVEDASNRQKRSFSIILSGIFQYEASGQDGSTTVDVDEPADVIAGDTRSQIDVVRSVLDPVISMVKRACPPTASEKECQKALAKEKKEEMEKCSAFPDLLKFFKQTEELFNDEEFMKFICEMVDFSKKCGDDEAALEYLDNFMNGDEYEDLRDKLAEWYEGFGGGEFPCNLPPGECNSETDTDDGSTDEDNTEDEDDSDENDQSGNEDNSEEDKPEKEDKPVHYYHHRKHHHYKSHYKGHY